MINPKIEQAINEQINAEMYSAYLYLSMAAYAQTIGLKGFANWLKIQYQEENDHAMIFYNYVIERGGKITLEAIEKPQTEWKSIADVFEHVLQHEQFVTARIHNLMTIAIDEKDYATVSLLNWFVDEQVEEEATVEDFLNTLRMGNDFKGAIFMLDREAATRTYTTPAPLLNK